MNNKMPTGFQLVFWFPSWQGFGFTDYRGTVSDMKYIYEWLFWFGFWEIRKWSKLKILS